MLQSSSTPHTRNRRTSIPYSKPSINHSVSGRFPARWTDLRPTAMGLDALPAWFLHLGAPFFTEPLTAAFNKSILTSTIPKQWRTASIVPIPKILSPLTPQDYRPISITPVLFRLLERLVVRQYIYPTFRKPSHLNFHDQYAFRPSGSTTAALVSLLQCITRMLETNAFVVMYALDFSKAFDTVRHMTLMNKVASLPIPDFIHNRIYYFLADRGHSTRHKSVTSTKADINASVIQGSALGPALYIINAADLKPLHEQNALFKYADDTYLLVPAESIKSAASELMNIETWAANNNLRLNKAKSAEIVFIDPNKAAKYSNFASLHARNTAHWKY